LELDLIYQLSFTYLLVFSGEFHEKLVVVKDLDGFLDGFHLLNCRIWSDIRVGGLDIVEDWIASGTLPASAIVSASLLSHSGVVDSSDGGLLVGGHGFTEDRESLLKEG
jgi:hypothetical protein